MTLRRLMPAVGLLATAAVISAATAEWWLLALGALAGGALALVSGRALPEGLDAAHQARAKMVLASLMQLEDARAVPASVIEALAQQALRLISRHQDMQRSVQMTPEAMVRSERDRLSRLTSTERDSASLARYREALEARDGQLADAASIRMRANRLEAEISSVHAKIDAIHTQWLALRSMRSTSGLNDRSRQINQALGSLSHELSALTEAYASLEESKELQ